MNSSYKNDIKYTLGVNSDELDVIIEGIDFQLSEDERYSDNGEPGNLSPEGIAISVFLESLKELRRKANSTAPNMHAVYTPDSPFMPDAREHDHTTGVKCWCGTFHRLAKRLISKPDGALGTNYEDVENRSARNGY